MLVRCLQNFLVRIESPDAFASMKMVKAKPVDWAKVLAEWGAVGLSLRNMGAEMQSPQFQCKVGILFVGDLVAFAFEGSYGVGFIQGIVAMGDGTIFGIISRLFKEADACFSKSPVRVQTVLLSAVSFLGVFPYFCQGDKVYMVASGDLSL